MAVTTEQRVVHCENGEISYLLTRKQVKNVNLRIKPDGSVLVSANNRVPTDFIDGFIKQKQKFIFSVLAENEEKRKLVKETPKQYSSGENYHLLGKNFKLKVEESKKEAVYIEGDHIILKVKNKDYFRHKEIMMTRWLKEYQIEIFQKLIEEKYMLLQKYGVPYPELKVRCMTSMWGSCRPKRGIVTLNSKLIELPQSSIEYVVLHELVHFIYPNHSKQFWDFVEMMMPDWKQRKMELENRERSFA